MFKVLWCFVRHHYSLRGIRVLLRSPVNIAGTPAFSYGNGGSAVLLGSVNYPTGIRVYVTYR